VLSDLGAVVPRVDVSIVQGFQNQISHIRQISLKVKVNCAIPHEECRQRAHLPSLGHEPDETLMSVGMASVMPDLWLPSQLHSIAAL